MKILLEAGKKYRRRDGTGPVEIASIIQDYESTYPVEDYDGDVYTLDGRNWRGLTSELDLVEEWQDVPKEDAKHLKQVLEAQNRIIEYQEKLIKKLEADLRRVHTEIDILKGHYL
jgi:hypothetical protein